MTCKGGGEHASVWCLCSTTMTVYYYVFEWFDVFRIHHCHIGINFAVVKFMETITSQLYQALTHAMRIIPWLWTTTPLRGSWKITSLQSAQVQAPTSTSRTWCPRSPSVHSELHFSEPITLYNYQAITVVEYQKTVNLTLTVKSHGIYKRGCFSEEPREKLNSELGFPCKSNK